MKNMKFPMAAGGPVIALLITWLYAETRDAEFSWLIMLLAVVFAVAGMLWPQRFQG